jgi:hypothetical protein
MIQHNDRYVIISDLKKIGSKFTFTRILDRTHDRMLAKMLSFILLYCNIRKNTHYKWILMLISTLVTHTLGDITWQLISFSFWALRPKLWFWKRITYQVSTAAFSRSDAGFSWFCSPLKQWDNKLLRATAARYRSAPGHADCSEVSFVLLLVMRIIVTRSLLQFLYILEIQQIIIIIVITLYKTKPPPAVCPLNTKILKTTSKACTYTSIVNAVEMRALRSIISVKLWQGKE